MTKTMQHLNVSQDWVFLILSVRQPAQMTSRLLFFIFRCLQLKVYARWSSLIRTYPWTCTLNGRLNTKRPGKNVIILNIRRDLHCTLLSCCIETKLFWIASEVLLDFKKTGFPWFWLVTFSYTSSEHSCNNWKRWEDRLRRQWQFSNGLPSEWFIKKELSSVSYVGFHCFFQCFFFLLTFHPFRVYSLAMEDREELTQKVNYYIFCLISWPLLESELVSFQLSRFRTWCNGSVFIL